MTPSKVLRFTGLRNPESVDLAAEGALINAQFTGCCHFFPLVSLEGLLDCVFFDLFEGQAGWIKHESVFGDNMVRQIVQVNHIIPAKNKGMLYGIFELAYISWPVIEH